MAEANDMKRKVNPEVLSSEERMVQSDYAQVLFHNIAESYTPDADIECHYTITSLLEPQPRDWVGIYRVGWSSVRDYACFNWSPMSPDYERGKDMENCITFHGNKNPKEDGEFYQFCYVTSKDLVRGASTPFQFRQPGMDDFVEIEDMEDDIMVVKTRTSALEDDLKVVLLAKEKLIERSRMLENERDGLVGRLVEYEQKMGSVKKERDMLAKIVEDCKGKLDSVRASNKDLETKHGDMLKQLEQLASERDAVAQKLVEKESEMRLLQDRIVTLVKDNDMLSGDKKSLIEQKELFESHFSTSESRMVAYQRERDDTKKQIAALEEMCATQREDVIRFKTEAERLKTTLARQNSSEHNHQIKVDSLSEQLHNAEDKLAAAEHCKRLVNDEMTTLDQARQKTSADLEESRSQVHKLNQRLARLESQQSQENELISDEVAKFQVMLQNEIKEKERLQDLLQQSNEQMREFVIGRLPQKEAALQVLQDAQKDLKKQFSRTKKKALDMQKKIEKLHREKREWRQRESELMQEVGDLKERLLMGQDEYRTQFVECARIKRELSRAQKSAMTQVTSSLEGPLPMTPQCEKEVQVTTEVTGVDLDDNSSQTDRESVPNKADQIKPDIQTRLDELGQELEERKEKKNHYKKLFHEEREKNEFLQSHYFQQLQTCEAETNRMIDEVKVQAESDRSELNKTVAVLTFDVEKRNKIIKQMKFEMSTLTAKSNMPKTDERRPRLHPGKAVVGPATCSYPDELDPLLNAPRDLTTPLTPLPAPISPVVLPAAKLAAVKAAIPTPDPVAAAFLEELCEAPKGRIPEPRTSDDSDTQNLTDPPREAVSDMGISLSEKTCPVCNGIMQDMSEEQMMNHINDHYGQECPMCNKNFPQNEDKEAFRQHVMSHFPEDA